MNATKPPRLIEQPAAKYHADRSRWSKGMLFDFYRRQDKAHRSHILGEGERKEPTPAMTLGSLVHATTSEPETIARDYAVIPSALLSIDGKPTTNAARDFADFHRSLGKQIITEADRDLAAKIAAALRDVVGHIIDNPATMIENVIQWTDQATGVDCRCRPDLLTLLNPITPQVIDIKTAADPTPEGFTEAAGRYGYWLQDAHYSAGVEALTGHRPAFYFVVAETSWPFAVSLHQTDSEQLDAIADEYRDLLAAVANCQRSGQWRDEWAGRVNKITYKPWALKSRRLFRSRY